MIHNEHFQRFARKGWRRSRRGNWSKKIGCEFVTVFYRDGGYKFVITCSDDDSIFSDQTFPTLLGAKLAVFSRFQRLLSAEHTYAN
jgi:hypothetical protein